MYPAPIMSVYHIIVGGLVISYRDAWKWAGRLCHEGIPIPPSANETLEPKYDYCTVHTTLIRNHKFELEMIDSAEFIIVTHHVISCAYNLDADALRKRKRNLKRRKFEEAFTKDEDDELVSAFLRENGVKFKYGLRYCSDPDIDLASD